jgi:AraC-like DNA-binding protein
MASFAPAQPLRDRIAKIEVIDANASEIRVLPSSAIVLGFQYSGRVSTELEMLSPAGITGLQSRARKYIYEQATGSVLVQFREQGATCFGPSLAEFSDRSLPLEGIVGAAQLRQVQDLLRQSKDAQAKVRAVEALVMNLPWRTDPLIDEALRTISLATLQRSQKPIVRTLVEKFDLSERQLERRFLQRVGMSPKRYFALRRFERACALGWSGMSLSEVALDAGYSDQAHFSREFRRFVDLSPGRFFGGRAP